MPLELTSQQITVAAIATGAAVAGSIGLWMLYNRRQTCSQSAKSVKKPSPNEIVGKVKRIILYPVKSMRGIDVDSAEALKRGFKFDRRFVVVNTANSTGPEGTCGDFLTLLKMPKLAQIQPRLEEVDGKAILYLKADGQDEIRIPEPDDVEGSERVLVHVQRVTGEGIDCGEEAAAWLASFTGLPGARLYYMSESVDGRHIENDPKWGSLATGGEVASFANFAPFMLCTEQSLSQVSERIGSELDVTRFRPNIVVESLTSAPFQEDNWSNFSIADAGFYLLKKCGRCPMIQLDPNTGEKTRPQLLDTLREYRLETSDSRYANSPVFGMHYAADKEGIVRVGQEVVTR